MVIVASEPVSEPRLTQLAISYYQKEQSNRMFIRTIRDEWSDWRELSSTDQLCNPNLLDNWYFVNPVNQRNGYIVPAGVDYYTFTWEKVGRTDKPYPVLLRRDAANNYDCEIEIGGTRYVVGGADTIPGYCGNWIYTIDRWNLADGDGLLEIHDGYITYKDSAYFFQPIPQDTVKSLVGKTVTLSFLYSDGTLDTGSCNITSWSGNWNVFLEIGNIRVVGVDKSLLWVTCVANGKGMIAAKLELGDQQTLAHKENGVWVLNEIPDFGEQLRKCQRYFVRFPACHGLGGHQIETNVCFRYSLDVPMRTVPSLVLENQTDLTNAIDNGVSTATPSAFYVWGTNQADCIAFWFEGAPTPNTCWTCKRYIDASADL